MVVAGMAAVAVAVTMKVATAVVQVVAVRAGVRNSPRFFIQVATDYSSRPSIMVRFRIT